MKSIDKLFECIIKNQAYEEPRKNNIKRGERFKFIVDTLFNKYHGIYKIGGVDYLLTYNDIINQIRDYLDDIEFDAWNTGDYIFYNHFFEMDKEEIIKRGKYILYLSVNKYDELKDNFYNWICKNIAIIKKADEYIFLTDCILYLPGLSIYCVDRYNGFLKSRGDK